MQVVDPGSLINITLQVRGYDILSAFPLRGFISGTEDKAETTWIANLGLLGKMTGAVAIVSNDMKIDENGKISIETSLKSLGILGMSRFILLCSSQLVGQQNLSPLIRFLQTQASTSPHSRNVL